MPRPYPDDLRMRAVEKVLAGDSRRSVAKELRAAASSVIKWARRYSDTGSAGPDFDSLTRFQRRSGFPGRCAQGNSGSVALQRKM